MDLNVRVIKAVECCPTLYKGHASIDERQAVWQQLAEQMQVPETVLKTRWHLLCAYYQRSLEKSRSTDEGKNLETGAAHNNFRYEAEMAFMMPYIHARIAIAAANAARKQQELAQAGVSNLTEPEFVITEKDIELATTVSNQIAADYAFYEVETFEQQNEEYDDSGGVDVSAVIETSQDDFIEGDVIEHIDESGNILMQDIIYETSEDGGEIEIEEEGDVLQMDNQIEVQTEQVIEEMVDDEVHEEDENEYITDRYSTTMDTEENNSTELHSPSFIDKERCLNISEIKAIPHDKSDNTEINSPFNQEYSLMTRRRPAVVLKATPRVQVELTDNATIAATNIVLQESQQKKYNEKISSKMEIGEPTVEKQQPVQHNLSDNSNSKNNEIVKIETVPVVQTQQVQEESKSISSTENHTNENSNKNERSEDTIFGELVTAMLKQMPPEKKRTIKKSIMDLLLT